MVQIKFKFELKFKLKRFSSARVLSAKVQSCAPLIAIAGVVDC